MMHKIIGRRVVTMVAAAGFVMLGACDAISGIGGDAEKGAAASGNGAAAAGAAGAAPANALDPHLANPAVGDVWAANLDHFSAAEFNTGAGDAGGDAYGLVRVVDVTPERVTIITEMGALPDQQAAIERLGDYQGSIQWDDSERIPINRADFAALVRDRYILRTSRPEGAAASAPSGGNSGDYSAGAGAGAAPAAPGGGK